MPKRATRSRERSRSRSHDRQRSASPQRISLSSLGVSEIEESDYFQKSVEFRQWLKDEKGKYFDELTGDKARSYFRKFIKQWNRGRLPRALYSGIDPLSQSATTQTQYQWSFAKNRSKVNKEDLNAARQAVGEATYGSGSSSQPRVVGPSFPPPSSKGRVAGPTLPSSSDFQLLRESQSESAAMDRSASQKRARLENRERLEDVDGGVGPRESGREGALEKKRAQREDNRAVRDRKDDAGLEVADDVLLGGGDSFAARVAQRDANRAKWEAKKQTGRVENNDRFTAMKARDAETMAMFQNMAAARFGSGS